MSSKKRKRDPIGQQEGQKRHPQSCIIHMIGIDHGPFTPFNNVKGSTADKLAQLHAIHDRRLAEPQTSPYRTVDVCRLIPESLEGMNLETVGYHRGC